MSLQLLIKKSLFLSAGGFDPLMYAHEGLDLTYRCTKVIDSANKKSNIRPKWQGGDMNVLIPMAGAGSRFEKAGYTFPKPLIEVNGKPMIQVVVENLNIDAKHIFIVQKEHYEKYNLKYLLNLSFWRTSNSFFEGYLFKEVLQLVKNNKTNS